MEKIENDENKRLNVDFYPIRNRYVETRTQWIYRVLLLVLLLCIIIGAIVLADFSGYALQDIKAFFSDVEEIGESYFESSGLQSMYAGHSVHPSPPGEQHNREAHHAEFQVAGTDSQYVSVSGYYGIDVSHWQQNIDWQRVAQDTIPQKLNFAIVKATQGEDQTDPAFGNNWEQVKNLFEIAGAYHFYIYRDDPAEQARNFINTVQLEQGDFPPILDLELDCSGCDSLSVSKRKMINDLKQYISAIEEYYHVKPILYTNEDFYSEYLNGHFDEYDYWMAKYEKTPPDGMAGFQQEGSTGPPTVVMWQFTNNERIQGIVGRVDMNFFPASARDSLEFIE